MNVARAALILVGFLFLIGTVMGNIPDQATITSSPAWIVANGANQASIQVIAKNASTGVPVQGATITFGVNNSIYGTMSPLTVVTDVNGFANSTFTVGTKSGTAGIAANIIYSGADGSYNGVRTWYENIDHDSPYYDYFTYSLQGSPGSVVPFTITMTDRWSNPIDNRNPSDITNVTLTDYGPVPFDGGFYNGTGYEPAYSLPTDSNGNASVTIKLSSKPGQNSIWMDPVGSIGVTMNPIQVVSTGVPYSITQQFTPGGSPPAIPSDGTSLFTIIYKVYDAFGNPTDLQNVWINTSVPGEEQLLTSNSLGEIWVTYGPKSQTGSYTLTATPVSNTSINAIQTVEVYNTSPVSFDVTANPQTMASLDVSPTVTSSIKAKVIDIMGNPVENETVIFSLGSVTYPGGPYNVTALPKLLNTSALTDSNGYATVIFVPGAFSTNFKNLSYSPTATGNCYVTATWNGIPKNILLVWKNYPYLSVVTTVTPQTVAVNDTVDIDIKLNGDGFALQQHPVDVSLIMDTSGSMDDPMSGQTKIYWARQAATNFVKQMNPLRDQVGLVSFSDSANIDYHLSNNFAGVISAINAMSAGGSTNTRTAMKLGIGDVITYRNPDPKSIQAVVLMTDGAWNYDGDPLAEGTMYTSEFYGYDGTTDWYKFPSTKKHPFTGSQDMGLYAQANNIRIYPITFSVSADQYNATSTYNAMTTLATMTGGTHFHANTGNELNNVYTAIAGSLKTAAGVNTTMLLDFSSVTVNNQSLGGGTVFSYVPDTVPVQPPGSTWMSQYNATYRDYSLLQDQSAQWAANNQLSFNVGTVNLGDTWETNFRFKVLTPGNINVFGNNSVVKFNDSANTGIDSLSLPPTFITASQNLTSQGVSGEHVIALTNLESTATGQITTDPSAPVEHQL